MNKTRIYKRLSKATINGRFFLEGEKVTVTQRDGKTGAYVFHDLYWDCDMVIICLSDDDLPVLLNLKTIDRINDIVIDPDPANNTYSISDLYGISTDNNDFAYEGDTVDIIYVTGQKIRCSIIPLYYDFHNIKLLYNDTIIKEDLDKIKSIIK